MYRLAICDDEVFTCQEIEEIINNNTVTVQDPLTE